MTSLTQSAMLAKMQVRQWSGRKFDKDVSEEIADIHNATDAGRFNKLLMPRAATAPMLAAGLALRKHHATNTLPWAIDGVGLLPAKNFFPYMAEHRRLAILFDLERDRFIGGYEAAQDAARKQLGDMYNKADYPSADDLEGRIAVDVRVWPMPDASDFRVVLGDAEEARIRTEIEKSVNDAVAVAVRSLWQRVHDAVAAMHERLTVFRRDNAGKVHSPFRDSLVGNLRELVELLPRLNLTDDPALESMRRRLADRLCSAEPEDLRKDDALRERYAAECAAVLEAMAAYTGAAPAAGRAP